MPITPHANGEPLLKQSSSYSHSSQFATILLVVWSANGYSSALTSKATSNLLSDNTYERPRNSVIFRTNRSRCTLNKKILDLLEVESVSEESSGRANLIQREVIPQMFEKVSQSLKYYSFFFGPQIYIYIYRRVW